MERTFGTRHMTKPEGALREVHWPSMARMDQRTGDGRKLLSEGGGVRDLPRTFFFQFAQGEFGHVGAVPVGRIDQVTLHDDGNISGYGWIMDDTEGDGRRAAFAIETQMQRHNSIDLADIKAEIDIDEDFNLIIDFTEWKVGATTGVAKPAFADATIELTDETVAAWADAGPLVCDTGDLFEINVDLTDVTYEVSETLASAAATVPWDDFHIPEADEPHKVTIDEKGRVFGHLAQWSEPHRGYSDRLRFCPRPADNYAGFHHPGVLTDKGFVNTAPVFLANGHPKQSMRGLTQSQVNEAYGGIENTWADVVVTAGKHGPWISGRVRPGTSDEAIYAARASHVSGHWVGDELMAIVSIGVPGFKPGAGFATVEDGRVVELVASLAVPVDITPKVEIANGTLSIDSSLLQRALQNSLNRTFSAANVIFDLTETVDTTIEVFEGEEGNTEDIDFSQRARLIAIQHELDS